MPDSFRCEGEWIPVSGGVVETLYRHWAELLRSKREWPEKAALIDFLERQADVGGNICGISMDYEFAPEVFRDRRSAWNFMMVVKQTAENVRDVKAITCEAWDRTPWGRHVTLEEYWLDLLWTIYRALKQWVVPP